jgi:coenzyme PQQ precursor peptide PqqA
LEAAVRRRLFSQVLYSDLADAKGPALESNGRYKNPLIQHWFNGSPPKFIALQHGTAAVLSEIKISLANFWFRTTLSDRAEPVRFHKERQMAWKTPKIVEVPVGMEINMYACAARK